jgi:hypothetical protein
MKKDHFGANMYSCAGRLAGFWAVAALNTYALIAQCTQHEVPHTPVYLTASQVAQLAHQYFNPTTDTQPIGRTSCDDLVTMVAIAAVESNGFDSHAQLQNRDCSQDYGLWQNNDDTTNQNPAPACGVGSTADFTPSTAAQHALCQLQKEPQRGFTIWNAYNDRFKNAANTRQWFKYWGLAQAATQQFASDCGCQASTDFSVYISGNSFVCPPVPPTTPGGGLDGTTVVSGDPNDKVGSPGVGTARYVSIAAPLNYSIYFDNEPTATAAAQNVVIKDQLDPSVVDLTSLTLGQVTFANMAITPPAVPLSLAGIFSKDVDLRPATNIIVRITAALNQTTGLLTWIHTSLDPATMQPTTDPVAGFLPPGTEGSVSFSVVPKAASTGTQITNKATVVFDVNPPIDTPVWANTLDTTAPVSRVAALPPTQSTSCFKPVWSGSDVGSGLKGFSVLVSDNGSPYATWLTPTTATTGVFNGQAGHAYSFYSQAVDLAGNVEAAKTSPEATTAVSPTASCNGRPSLSGAASSKSSSGTTMTVNLQLANSGVGDAQNVKVTQIAFRTISGTGTVGLTGPALPVTVGTVCRRQAAGSAAASFRVLEPVRYSC